MIADASAARDHVVLARVLGAEVPDHWPPIDLADVLQLMSDRLKAEPHAVGWWGWYMVTLPGIVATSSVLVGSCGCSPFGDENCPMFGYGILPQFERRGLTSEAALAVAEWAIAQPGVRRLQATTFERHAASIRILTRCGFVSRGVSPHDAEASERDRQGRGRLLLFERLR